MIATRRDGPRHVDSQRGEADDGHGDSRLDSGPQFEPDGLGGGMCCVRNNYSDDGEEDNEDAKAYDRANGKFLPDRLLHEEDDLPGDDDDGHIG